MICEQGYEMQNRYCQRMDNIQPLGVPNQQQNAQSSIQMPNDILGAPPPSATAASKKVGTDNLLAP